MKRCPKCSQTKEHSEFDKNAARHDGLHSWCKPCRVKSARNNHIMFKYGISADEYDSMLDAQDGLCYICRQPEKRKNRSGKVSMLSIDHNHSTGEIRALLCDDCNNGIARFHESPELLASAIEYLEEFNR